jgi:hypothetical protein
VPWWMGWWDESRRTRMKPMLCAIAMKWYKLNDKYGEV